MLPEQLLSGAAERGIQLEMGVILCTNIDTNSVWCLWVSHLSIIQTGIVSGDLPEQGIKNYDDIHNQEEFRRFDGHNANSLPIVWSSIEAWPSTLIDVDYSYNESYNLIEDVKITKDTLEEISEMPNKGEVGYYRGVIYSLRRKPIKVIVFLNHFTLPYWLHDPIEARERALTNKRNGWVNPRSVNHFAKYAAYIAYKFGDIEDMWSTFFEPILVVELGYLAGYSPLAPGVLNPEAAKLAILHMINAHALAYRQIKKFDTEKADKDSLEPAEEGIIYNNIGVRYPNHGNDSKDVKAAENDNNFHSGLFFDRIHIGKLNIEFDRERFIDAAYLKPNDWIGVNYYTREVVTYQEPMFPSIPLITFKGVQGYGYACRPGTLSKDDRPVSDIGWELYPEGMYDSIVYYLRAYYIATHIKMREYAFDDGYDDKGYFHCGLTDYYEWAVAFSKRYALYELNVITKQRIRSEMSVSIIRVIVGNNAVSNLIEEEKLSRII
nr:beta-galactosidase [uncultured bacterium]